MTMSLIQKTFFIQSKPCSEKEASSIESRDDTLSFINAVHMSTKDRYFSSECNDAMRHNGDSMYHTIDLLPDTGSSVNLSHWNSLKSIN